MFTRWFLQEKRAYGRLSPQARSLVISFFLFSLAQPFLFVFASTFLWRDFQSVPIILLYNAAFFFGLPAGFFINAALLRYVSANTLYAWGCVLQGIAVALLVFADGMTPIMIPLFGIAYGIAGGLFWGNRNVFTVCATSSHDRIYFASIENLVATVTSIIMPLAIGWAIVGGSSVRLYAPETAYRVLSIVAVVLLACTGLVLRGKPFCLKPPSRLFVRHIGSVWTRWRLVALLEGLASGMDMVLPTVIAILFIGMEGEIGSLRSAIAIISSLTMYIIGRTAKTHARKNLLTLGILLSMIGWVGFGLLFSASGVIFMSIASAFGSSLFWLGFSSAMYDAVEEEERASGWSSFSLLSDRELFLNIGRIGAVSIIFLAWYAIGSAWSLRLLPVLIYATQLYLPSLISSRTRT